MMPRQRVKLYANHNDPNSLVITGTILRTEIGNEQTLVNYGDRVFGCSHWEGDTIIYVQKSRVEVVPD